MLKKKVLFKVSILQFMLYMSCVNLPTTPIYKTDTGFDLKKAYIEYENKNRQKIIEKIKIKNKKNMILMFI